MNENIDMQVVARDRAVTLLFSRRPDDNGDPAPAAVDHMTMDPETALLAAQMITDLAFEADSSIKPVGPALKANLIEKHRAVLIPRITTVMNSLRTKRTVTNQQLAVQLMDIVCSEVF